MAWRLNDFVVSGVIDNTERGRVHGKLWLGEKPVPINLELRGNCEEDLAGCRIEFRNINAKPKGQPPNIGDQTGDVGCFSASNKVWATPNDIDPMFLTKSEIKKFGQSNLLYLEWFSARNGRVVVEIIGPQIKVSGPVWTFTDKEIRERESRVATGFVHRIALDEIVGRDAPLDEFQYEKVLRKFDDHVAQFEELWERYKDDPDVDRKVADAMGMTIMSDIPIDEFRDAYPEFEEDETMDQFDPVARVKNLQHPLVDRALELCVSIGKYADSISCDSEELGGIERVVSTTTEGMGKLANALSGHVDGEEFRDAALLVAILKRALGHFHQALEALDLTPQISHELRQAWRSELMEIRQEVLNEMQIFRERIQ